MKNQWAKDPDRIAYYEHEKTKGGLPAIDEMVIHNANVHNRAKSEFCLKIIHHC